MISDRERFPRKRDRQLIDLDLTTRTVPLPVALLFLVLALVGAWYLYRREYRLVRPSSGRALVGLRLALIGAITVLATDPVHEEREIVSDPGEVLVVVDASRSFALPDPERPTEQVARELLALSGLDADLRRGLAAAASGAPLESLAPRVRSEVMRARELARREVALRAIGDGWLARLAERYRVSLFSLATTLAPVPENRLERVPPADGPATDLIEPLLGTVLRRGIERVAGVVLVTDGNHRGGGDPREAARRLGELDVPIVAIGIGADTPPRDLVLADVDLAGSVFAGDEVLAEVVVESTFSAPVSATLRVEDSGEVLHQREIALSPGTSRLPVGFRVDRSGRRRLLFGVRDASGEARADNNEKALWLDVPQSRARVLLLDRGPRWEWRFLRASWERDDKVDLSAYLLTPSPDVRLPDAFPRTQEALYAHDVVVLGDVVPAVFAREERQLLSDFVVRRGGTLVVIAGEHAMPYAWSDTVLADVLPVRLLRPAPSLEAQRDSGRAGWPLTLGERGLASGIGRLVPGKERNLRLWETLPPPRWVAPVAGVRDGADVIAHVAAQAVSRMPGISPGALRTQAVRELAATRAPVVVVRPHGAGRVLFVGTDATWRWRFELGDELYQRFWGQVARWAMEGGLVAGDDAVRLGTWPAVVGAPGEIRLDAFVRLPVDARREDEFLEAVVTRLGDGARARTRLAAVPGTNGRFRLRLAVGETGELTGFAFAGSDAGGHAERPAGGRPEEFELSVSDAHDRDPAGGAASSEDPSRVRFAVAMEGSPETRDLARNAALLTELAALSGGAYLPLERLGEAEESLRDRTRLVERTRARSPWNVPLVVATLLLVLLCGEWWLRKRCDLV